MDRASQNRTEQAGSGGELLSISFSQWCRTVRIKTDKGLKPFSLFPWQESFADLVVGDDALTRRAIALLSSRQTGKTSLMLALAAYLSQAREQFTIIFVHRTTADAFLLCRRIKRLLSGVKLRTDSLSLLEFADSNSVIYFRSANPAKRDGGENCARGIEHADLLIVEEAAHLENLEQVRGSVAPTMTWSNIGLMLYIGTAGSKQSFYYESLARSAGGAENLENILSGIRAGDKEPFQVMDTGTGTVGVVTNWRAIEQFRSEPNFLKRVQGEFDLSDAQMNSEYELIFGSAADAAVFDFGLVMAAQADIEPYEHSPADIIYLGVDPAGVGKDFAVCVALMVTKEGGQDIYTVVQVYRKRTGTSEQHLRALDQMIIELDPLRTAIEVNSLGQVWLENLAGRGHSSPIDGVATTASSKPVLISRLQLALERGILRIPKGPIIDELLAYRRFENGRMGAGGNSHDDTVIALSLALQASKFNQYA